MFSGKAPELVARFWTKVDRSAPGGCWLWTDAPDDKGYGRFWDRRVMANAHRIAYRLVVGPIPTGLELDHLCRNTMCVNPAHLEPVTHQENMARGVRATRTHCFNGHPYEGGTTSRRGGRECRTCMRAYRRAWKDRQKAENP